ncbi:hypothetical protein L3Q82_012129 [Scortum barcoo]|uniref:Uncharacterized protein n=1 Tax=Scortum barcoo TaxID=214431 RepID=A0ACB8W798_9TELE|nr:hypothetical protein L3Q82_012129 [Scortum barcoo]
MSETRERNSRVSAAGEEERRSAGAILMSDPDESFLKSLFEFVEHEKLNLQSPEQGPDQIQYTIYRSVFNQVISRSSTYQRLLLTIKAEYDNVIGALQQREEEARQTVANPQSLKACQRRAAQLRDRICVLEMETAELQEQIKRQKSCREQSSWIPGVTVAESDDPEALDRHLKRLEAQRAALLERRRVAVFLWRYKRLRFVSEHLSGREDERQQLPLEEVLTSTLGSIRQGRVSDGDTRTIDAELFKDDEPVGVDESKLLTDHLDRFIKLFDSAQYEEAALIAARSPWGVLRTLDTMEMFKGREHSHTSAFTHVRQIPSIRLPTAYPGVKPPPGSVPPLLLFFQALLMTTTPGSELSSPISLQAVHGALQHGATQLISHAVTHNKLTFSEELGVTSWLSMLRKTLERKTALSMCRRGLIHSTAEFMNHSKDLTAEDCMWVLCHSPSLSLLQLLTEPLQSHAAILSVGVACSTLLASAQQQEVALQLLDSFVSRGQGALEEVILEDSGSSVDVWADVASLCADLNRADLSQAVTSVLLGQSGTRVLSPDLEGGRLMEHIYL